MSSTGTPSTRPPSAGPGSTRTGQSAEASSTETHLTRAAIALSIVLVLALAGLAIYSVVSQTRGTNESTDPVADLPDDTGDAATDPSIQLEIDDLGRPLDVGCRATAGLDHDHVVTIFNRADETLDYLVTVALTGTDGQPVSATADVPSLGPGEQRQVGVRPDRPARGSSDCRITSVQSRGRIISANS